MGWITVIALSYFDDPRVQQQRAEFHDDHSPSSHNGGGRRLQGGHSDDIAVEIDMAAVVNYIVIGLITYVALQPVWYLVLHLTDQQRRDNASTAQECIAPCALVLFYERECNPMAIFALFFGVKEFTKERRGDIEL